MDPSTIFLSKKTTLEDILNLKKDKIVNYLRNRGQKISGNKHELAVRALNFSRNELGVSASISNFSSTYDLISLAENEKLPDFEELNSGWTSDTVNLPKMKVADIEKYLIHSSHRTSDSLKMECYRQYIRGLNFYKEDYIHKIMTNNISESSKYCYVRSKCHPSMKQGVYTQWVLMTKNAPINILKASCTCPAGLGEGCSHISGLLFAIEGNASNHEKSDNTACTSKPCEWDKPSKRKRGSKPVENIAFKKIKLHDSETKPTSKHSSEKISEEKMSSFRNKLCSKLGNNSNAVLFDLLPPSLTVTSVESDLNLAEEVVVESSENIQYKSDKYINLRETVHESNMTASQFLTELSKCDPDTVAEIEVRTRGQNQNSLWIKSRTCRITASVFHDVLHRKKTTSPQILVDKILAGPVDDKSNLNVPSLNWGRKMEVVARKNYIAVKKLKDKQNIKVIEQGLHVHHQYSFLGASPDGLAVDNSEKHLIEIKCPYNWRFKTVGEACSNSDFCCYKDKHGTIFLKENHRYCTQIQGQMGITGIPRCDLVIYTTKDIKVLTISFNPVFWCHLLEHLKQYYSQHVLPRLVNSAN